MTMRSKQWYTKTALSENLTKWPYHVAFPILRTARSSRLLTASRLALEQQVTKVLVAAPAIDEHPDVPVDCFHYAHADLGPAVVGDAVQVFQ